MGLTLAGEHGMGCLENNKQTERLAMTAAGHSRLARVPPELRTLNNYGLIFRNE